MTFVLGLTGSIGMGKSTVAGQCRYLGAVVSDADATVHRLMAPGGAAFTPIAAKFPQVMENGRINRRKLGQIVFTDDEALHWLEGLLHPLVRAAHLAVIRRARYQRRPWVVLEIPLLYETGAEAICDAVAVVTSPEFIQHQRVMKRAGMTEEKFRQILAKQMPDAEKRRRADAVIETGQGKAFSLKQVKALKRYMEI